MLTQRTRRGTLPVTELDALRAAGYTERQIIEIAFGVYAIVFANLVNRINDTVTHELGCHFHRSADKLLRLG